MIDPAPPGPVECVRKCAPRRWFGIVGVGGAWAICAMPPVRSTLSNVVGFVLTAILAKVRGSDKYEDEDLDGEGEGGALGGIGRTEASSSASYTLLGDHTESSAPDTRRWSSDS